MAAKDLSAGDAAGSNEAALDENQPFGCLRKAAIGLVVPDDARGLHGIRVLEAIDTAGRSTEDAD
jgi:hypothetical protein